MLGFVGFIPLDKSRVLPWCFLSCLGRIYGCAWFSPPYEWFCQLLIHLLRFHYFRWKAKINQFWAWVRVSFWLGCVGAVLVLSPVPAAWRLSDVSSLPLLLCFFKSVVACCVRAFPVGVWLDSLPMWPKMIVRYSFKTLINPTHSILLQVKKATYKLDVWHSRQLTSSQPISKISFSDFVFNLLLRFLSPTLSFMDKGKQKIAEQLFSEVVKTASVEVKNPSSSGDDNIPLESGKNIKPKNKITKKRRYVASVCHILNCDHSLMENHYLDLTILLSKLSTAYLEWMACMAALSGLLKLLSWIRKKDNNIYTFYYEFAKVCKDLCMLIGIEQNISVNLIPYSSALVLSSCCLVASRNNQFSKIKVKESMTVRSGFRERFFSLHRAPRNEKLIYYLLSRCHFMARIINQMRSYPTVMCNTNEFSWYWSFACWLCYQGMVRYLQFRLKLCVILTVNCETAVSVQAHSNRRFNFISTCFDWLCFFLELSSGLHYKIHNNYSL